jgi:hypothetical protein
MQAVNAGLRLRVPIVGGRRNGTTTRAENCTGRVGITLRIMADTIGLAAARAL